MPQYKQLGSNPTDRLIGHSSDYERGSERNSDRTNLRYWHTTSSRILSARDNQTTSDFVKRVRERIDKMKPQSIIRHGTRKVFVFRELASTPYVFLRNDTVKGPLQPPYDGPYKVIERGGKNFKILINNKNTIVSIDRLKPVFIIRDEIEQQLDERDTEPLGIIVYPKTRTEQNIVPGTPREENARVWYVTRSGRCVCFPDRYQAGRS
jgi:hypothetical protein